MLHLRESRLGGSPQKRGPCYHLPHLHGLEETCNDHRPGLFDAGFAPGMFPVSLGDVVQDSPVGAADAVVGIPIAPVVGILIVVGIRLTKVPHKKN